MTQLQQVLTLAKNASRSLNVKSSEKKNEALLLMANYLEKYADDILEKNKQDVENSKQKLGEVMTDRLRLDEKRIKGMADGIREVVKLVDPVGVVLDEKVRPNGINIKKISVPLGVIAIIYESRPNVTSDAGALCLKSSNACILRCGKEAYETSKEIVKVLRLALKDSGFDENCICIAPDSSRETATEIMQAVGYVDALIPRGGAGLIRSCVENAKVPCIQTGTGICHVYVDESADFDMALNIIDNAKTSRPSVCNAMEVLLVNEKISTKFLPLVKNRLVDEKIKSEKNVVQFRLCEKSAKIIDGKKADSEDFDTEFLSYVLAVKIVGSVSDAIEHIAKHSTGHSECIITKNQQNAELFISCVDSSAVYVNASTRFTDGGEFGKGCEIGISTQKMHARGPMGLEELTSYKYVVLGNGQIR